MLRVLGGTSLLQLTRQIPGGNGAQAAPPAAPPVAAPRMVYCTQCGTRYDASRGGCPNCGTAEN